MQGALSIPDVVRKQVTSPDFADWCLTNVANPHYDYLFNKSAARRQEYEAALAAFSQAKAPQQQQPQQVNSAQNRVAAAPNLAAVANAIQATVLPNQSHCMIAPPKATQYVGPHPPYVLVGQAKATLEEMLSKLSSINVATTGTNQNTTEALTNEVVTFMLRRRTKTESMVHRLVASFGGLGMQKRLEYFYLLSTLFYEHRMAAEANCDAPYMNVFAVYLVEALRLCLFLCKTDDPEVRYLQGIVIEWGKAQVMPEHTLRQMHDLLGSKLSSK